MATFTRKNAWDQNGTFSNPDLLWYAKAVQIMQSRPISNPTSWWFYAAVHGEFLLPGSVIPPPPPPPDYTYLNWANISYISPAARLGILPPKIQTDLFWDQCQHGSWYFQPWHRGYLAALENILRGIIVDQLNGPNTWALPYWNYLNQSTADPENDIPPAFTDPVLPDGTPNPLLVPERYGPVIKVGKGPNSINDACQWDTIYSEETPPANPSPGDIYGFYYGGGETGFSHSPNIPETGDLEQNPHNLVHGAVGGTNSNSQVGIMGVPNTAALDPVFYLHHANIDRMWAAWNVAGNANPTDAKWLAGPSAQGNPQFAMPFDANGTPWYYTPEDVGTTTSLRYYNGATYSYTYDDLSLTSYDTTPPTQVRRTLLQRLSLLGVPSVEKRIQMQKKITTELVGASRGPLTLTGGEARADVHLDTGAWKTVSKSFSEAFVSGLPDEVYLQLESVKGGIDSNVLSVYVNQKFVKSVSLFGMISASLKSGPHGDGGLTFRINITNIIDGLQVKSGNVDIDSLDIEVKAKDLSPEGTEITISRIGIYRSGK